MTDEWKIDKESKCRVCEQAGFVYYRLVETGDGAYTDEQYHCKNCDSKWWIDGADA